MAKKAKSIVVAGKGGSGKTTIAALLILYLAEKGIVLAIDGDPSSNLNLALGLPLESTLGDVREETLALMSRGHLDGWTSKPDYIQFKIQQAVEESAGVDLLAMGRPEGSGCYCALNHLLRAAIDRLTENYDYVVIDSEAGMEHISRQTTQDVDILLIISDPTMRGITTASQIKKLIHELRSSVGAVTLAVNRANSLLSLQFEQAVEDSELELIWSTPG